MKRVMVLRVFMAFLLLACMTTMNIRGEEPAKEEKTEDCAAYAAGIVGKPEYQAKDSDKWLPLELNSCIYKGDKIRTPEDGSVALQFGPKVQVRINANANFVVQTMDEASETPDKIDLKEGEMWSQITKEGDEDVPFEVNTPSGVVAVKGTEFNVAVDKEGKSTINVLDGVVKVFNELGEVLAEAGKMTEMFQGKLPLDPKEFDVAAFKDKLNAWKDQISIGAVKDALKKKVEEKKEEIKGKLKVPKF